MVYIYINYNAITPCFIADEAPRNKNTCYNFTHHGGTERTEMTLFGSRTYSLQPIRCKEVRLF